MSNPADEAASAKMHAPAYSTETPGPRIVGYQPHGQGDGPIYARGSAVEEVVQQPTDLAAHLAELGVTPIESGYRVRETDEFVVDVWRATFNWRLVSYEAGQQMNVDRGYCLYGRNVESLTRAIIAGLSWEDPRNSDPADYDKRAFPDPLIRRDPPWAVQA